MILYGKLKNVFSVTTNGYDLNCYEDFLKPGYIESMQITIDGTQKVHDNTFSVYTAVISGENNFIPDANKPAACIDINQKKFLSLFKNNNLNIIHDRESFSSLNENLVSEFSIQQLEERLETNPLLSLLDPSFTVGQCVVSPCVTCISCVAYIACVACVTSA